MLLQLLLFTFTLHTSCVKEKASDDLYLRYDSQNENYSSQKTSNGREIFTFNIGAVKSTYSGDLPPLYFESLGAPKILSKTNLNLKIRDIQWLKEAYLKAFEFFKNDPPGLNAQGEVLSFDLSKQFEKIFIIEYISSDSVEVTEVREIQIEN